MTIAELYALYLRVHAEYDRRHAFALPSSPIARVIAEFAQFDAQNGVAARSRADFERCVAQGADALAPLGLRAA